MFFHGKPFFGTLVCTVSPIPHLKRCAMSASTYKLGGVGGLSLTKDVISQFFRFLALSYFFYEIRVILRVLAFLSFIVPGRPGT